MTPTDLRELRYCRAWSVKREVDAPFPTGSSSSGRCSWSYAIINGTVLLLSRRCRRRCRRSRKAGPVHMLTGTLGLESSPIGVLIPGQGDITRYLVMSMLLTSI